MAEQQSTTNPKLWGRNLSGNPKAELHLFVVTGTIKALCGLHRQGLTFYPPVVMPTERCRVCVGMLERNPYAQEIIKLTEQVRDLKRENDRDLRDAVKALLDAIYLDTKGSYGPNSVLRAYEKTKAILERTPDAPPVDEKVKKKFEIGNTVRFTEQHQFSGHTGTVVSEDNIGVLGAMKFKVKLHSPNEGHETYIMDDNQAVVVGVEQKQLTATSIREELERAVGSVTDISKIKEIIYSMMVTWWQQGRVVVPEPEVTGVRSEKEKGLVHFTFKMDHILADVIREIIEKGNQDV